MPSLTAWLLEVSPVKYQYWIIVWNNAAPYHPVPSSWPGMWLVMLNVYVNMMLKAAVAAAFLIDSARMSDII